MELHGWGRYPRVNAEVLEPINSEALQKILAGKAVSYTHLTLPTICSV